MTKTRILCRLLVCGLGGLPVDAAEPAAGFEGRIVDDATGAALAARVAVTNIHGEFLETEGRHSHVEYLGKRWCYVAGSFAFEVPEDGAGLEIRRGLETLPEHWEVEPLAAGKPAARTFRLRRWVNLQRQGHVCGDIHAHQPIPAEAVGQMEAEDLDALHLLHVADPYMAPAVNEEFTGAMDAHSRPGCEVRVGQEIRDWQMGHLNLLGLTGLIPGYPDMGGTMEYWRTMPHWDLVRAMQAAREQQGTVVWAHIASLPGAQLPVATALGLVDAVELITWHDPTQLPNHWSPWQNSGMSMAEFPVLRAVDLYYQFLNAGFHLPIAAGTDKFFEEIPLGSNRTYARVEGTADYAGWLAAIKAGRCFVSNGPILEFSVEDHQPGEVVTLSGPQTVVARVRARSILPFTTLEIVLNGAVVAHKTIAIPASEPIDGLYDMQIETSLELTHSAWLAARVVDHPDLPNRILPRDVAVFAHTSPVYFLRDGREVREPASVAYLGKWVAGLLHWLESHPPFANESDRQNARQTAEQALRYYRSPEGTRAQ
ncbi:MAG: CehA/McbA family metallohydrolase [Verrucomicrobiales bacterium]|nr:CehA/McbA family metallohydrolase [Verrucomicrobiales bacterium]